MTQTILVVDDEPEIVKLVRAYLEEAGYRVNVIPSEATATLRLSKRVSFTEALSGRPARTWLRTPARHVSRSASSPPTGFANPTPLEAFP